MVRKITAHKLNTSVLSPRFATAENKSCPPPLLYYYSAGVSGMDTCMLGTSAWFVIQEIRFFFCIGFLINMSVENGYAMMERQ